ncbi:MAG: aminotransferase class V-fold PLP-dependent enzyme, partial [Sphingomonadaceae bacterium]
MGISRVRIYLDHAATTPVLPEAREAIAAALDIWANPSSAHSEGRAARAAMERARADIAETLGGRHRKIITTGPPEALGRVLARGRTAARVATAA